MVSRNDTQQRQLQALQRKVSDLLSQSRRKDKPCPVMERKRRLDLLQRRMGRVVLPGNYVSTTQPGSLYSTTLLVLADKGRLAMQNYLFDQFRKQPTAVTARHLLEKIGVIRPVLDRIVRADPLYKQHCAKHTRRLHNLAARGDKHAEKILNNPKICCRGRWRGDIDEAVSILRGARDEVNLDRLKNVRILRRSNLMFDSAYHGEQETCYLYPRKYHQLFLKARALVSN